MMGKTECRLTECQVSAFADLQKWILYLLKQHMMVNVIKIMCQRLICEQLVVIIMTGQWLSVERCFDLSMSFTWYRHRS